MLEVLAKGLAQSSAEAVAILKQRANVVQQLTGYRSMLHDLCQARVDFLPLFYRNLQASRVFHEQHGLTVNDSLIVAVLQRERLQFLATKDPDFARVPSLVMRVP